MTKSRAVLGSERLVETVGKRELVKKDEKGKKTEKKRIKDELIIRKGKEKNRVPVYIKEN